MKQETRIYIWLIIFLLVAGGYRGYKYYQIKSRSEAFLLHKDSLFLVLNTRADSLFNSLNATSMKSEKDGYKININTATIEQLQRIPGIGPVLSENIVKFRSLRGGIKNQQQLLEVKGLGKKKSKKILKYIVF